MHVTTHDLISLNPDVVPVHFANDNEFETSHDQGYIYTIVITHLCF